MKPTQEPQEPDIIVVVPLKWGLQPLERSVKGECSRCHTEVWVSPLSQVVQLALPGVQLVCVDCFAPSKDTQGKVVVH